MKARLWMAICPWLDDFLAFGLESGEYRGWSGGCIWSCEQATAERRTSRENHFDQIRTRNNNTSIKGQIGIALDEYWPTIEPRLP